MVDDLRLELRARNNILWHAIFDSHASVSDFCVRYKLSQGKVGGLLNLTFSPWCKRHKAGGRSDGHLRLIALQLAVITGITVDELFPPMLYAITRPAAVIQMPTYRFVGLSAARHLALPPAQETDLAQQELREVMTWAVDTLTAQEKFVITRRFGLDGDPEQTHHDIGTAIGLSGGRIQQIAAKGLRKLRHPSRVHKMVHLR